MKKPTPNLIVSLPDFKKDPASIIDHANGNAVAVIDKNKPLFYCLPPKLFEEILAALEDEVATYEDE